MAEWFNAITWKAIDPSTEGSKDSNPFPSANLTLDTCTYELKKYNGFSLRF